MSYHQAEYDEPLIKDMKSGTTYRTPGDDLEDSPVPESLLRESLDLPDVAEFDVVRHYTRLSQMNYGVDIGMYPLGSCTMKYNPKFADQISAMGEFSELHPFQEEGDIQGALMVMFELQHALIKISDMDAITLQPLAGAQGEYTGILIAKKYLEATGQLDKRREIIVPDSAHGTNPASASMAGFDVVEIPSNGDGTVNLEALDAALSGNTAVFMITNPNTLGIFEGHIEKVAKLVHDAGAVLYYDGANLNAIMGKTSPGLMGFDIVHFNLHKTFATPHGGGGPGSGPVAVKGFLRDYLPVPIIGKEGDRYFLDYSMPHSIGKVAPYFGSFAMHLRAWAYITYHGADGLTRNTERAVLNTNYLASKLKDTFSIPFSPLKKHELVLSTENTGKRALEIAKYLLDDGIHPPTVYFPLIVHEDMMIEPTESVSKRDLDFYAEAMKRAAKVDEDELKKHPLNLPVKRIDEVRAARQLVLKWS
ncbi:glycine dehydrogenase [uncultured archaeon]|nr:glycine dehydrogenase [uncultured archaeon]